MPDEFVLYQKFANVESAEVFANELKENDIEYRLFDNNHAYVKMVGYHAIDIGVGLNIKQSDFPKADLILENYYDKEIEGIDKSYFLFQSSNEELKEIVMNPYDCGKLDLRLAKHLLSERGIEISDDEIEKFKLAKIQSMSHSKKESSFKLFAGYFFSATFPIIGIFIALLIRNNRTVLPNGTIIYNNIESDRKHANYMIIIGVIRYSISWIWFFYVRME